MDIASTTARFFLAAVIILITCRLVAMAARRIGQPPVVGEMIAGVLLGPSLLGLVFPGVQDALFPDAVRPMLYVVSHIGLVAFMFGVGHEFASQKVRGLGRPAGLVSLAGVATPLLLGAALILLVHNQIDILKDGVPLWVSALFVGVTLAITAFPMLARIITERKLTGSRLGSLAMASGAIDDGIAWVLLAVTIGLATGDPNRILVTCRRFGAVRAGAVVCGQARVGVAAGAAGRCGGTPGAGHRDRVVRGGMVDRLNRTVLGVRRVLPRLRIPPAPRPPTEWWHRSAR
ncbi:cation:proton antiporter [Kibdelosporangium aridum]|uniref:cation:proton antiporter n=1 Tax=Kibdelosporangium aridum TaxID=2030 RepID=UPI0035EF4EFE